MAYKDYQIGDIVTATVTGIQPYGVFASLDEETQGLIHISEVKHGFVDNVVELFELDEKIEVMVLYIDEFDGRMSFEKTNKVEGNDCYKTKGGINSVICL